LDFTDGAYADVTIQDNLFENNYRHITINPPTAGQATNFIIRRNVMKSTTSQEAVRLIGPNGVTLENNVIMNSTQQGLYIDSGTSNVNVWHNTFFNNGEEEIRTKVDSVDIVIKNNIIYANGISAALSANTSPLPSEDYNLVFNYGTDTESSSSQPAVTSFGANTIPGQDPLFVSTTAGSEDLHLQFGSPAIEAGVDLGVIDDIEKNARPNPTGTAPDIGAYEAGSSDDEGPVTTETTADPNPAAVGSSVLVTANVDDTTTGGSNIASANYEIYDDGDVLIGSGSMSPADVFDSPTEDVTASITAPTTAGIYDLCVYGTDAVGNTGESECIMFVVYDPSGGFVTGGGWIDSPAGAYKVPTTVYYGDLTLDSPWWPPSASSPSTRRARAFPKAIPSSSSRPVI
jgi:parallel beta-helix repeat protein